ncbi:hypothetical protein LOTGIDRAFT_175365 [Lottia gigantea]|uniref:Uncharacterized protein n=1 Tax=Lottia gigantea TaxID=225164 RepID=V4ACV5_LOTGI|nr:hypothetical protein LOTGIDRAFT_175365 [Lottia gigantea]ESO94682.1 hypothetical protein LOTGIDRAFT_175365 [Lottia gigantea]
MRKEMNQGFLDADADNVGAEIVIEEVEKDLSDQNDVEVNEPATKRPKVDLNFLWRKTDANTEEPISMPASDYPYGKIKRIYDVNPDPMDVFQNVWYGRIKVKLQLTDDLKN